MVRICIPCPILEGLHLQIEGSSPARWSGGCVRVSKRRPKTYVNEHTDSVDRSQKYLRYGRSLQHKRHSHEFGASSRSARTGVCMLKTEIAQRTCVAGDITHVRNTASGRAPRSGQQMLWSNKDIKIQYRGDASPSNRAEAEQNEQAASAVVHHIKRTRSSAAYLHGVDAVVELYGEERAIVFLLVRLVIGVHQSDLPHLGQVERRQEFLHLLRLHTQPAARRSTRTKQAPPPTAVGVTRLRR